MLESLVQLAQQGDQDAYGKLVGRFQDMAYGYAYSLLGDFHLAQDAAQEAFIQAYGDLKALRVPAAFPSWFRRIVFKYCDRIRRKRRGEAPLAGSGRDAASDGAGPPEAAERREAKDRVLDAVRALPEHQRTVTTLFYIDGYSVADIAGFLEAPVGTVKRRLHTARRQLREEMIPMVADTLKEHGLPDGFSREAVERAVRQAEAMNREGQWAEAERLMRETLKVAPGDPAALGQLNRSLLQGRVFGQDRWDLLPELAAHGREMLRSGIEDERIRRELAATLLAVPAMAEATEFLEAWLAAAGPSTERLGMLAWARGCMADYEGAESVWGDLLAHAEGAAASEVRPHLPAATVAMVDCFAAAGEQARAGRVAQSGWDLCSRRGLVRLQPDTIFSSWPHVFRIAGAEEDCAAVAREWHAVVEGCHDGLAQGEALCARAWFDEVEAVARDWRAWAEGRAQDGDWTTLGEASYAIVRAFNGVSGLVGRRLLAEPVLALLTDAGEQARWLREWWSLQRFPTWRFINEGDLDTAAQLARQAVDAGLDEELWRIREIAEIRGEPSAPETIDELRNTDREALDLFGWYHLAREAAAAGEREFALHALKRACSYWTNPPLAYVERWENDARWGALRDDPEFQAVLAEKRRRIGPIHGLLMYFPEW